MSVPKFDVVVYGGSGFTGSLVVQYLAQHPQQPRMAIAGRNRSKLEGVLNKLTGIDKQRVQSIEILEASTSDPASIKRMAASTKVVVNMVGPYAHLGGFEVAKAAAEAAAGYVDLTGESAFYARVVEQLQAQAQKTKAIIMPSVGFDSLPFDLGAYLAVQEVKKAAGPETPIGDVITGFNVKGTVSGGTIASVAGMRDVPEQLQFTRSYWFSPVEGKAQKENAQAHFLPQFKRWGAYSLLSPHNTRVIQRTWGIFDQAIGAAGYGGSFQYYEGMVSANVIVAWIVTYLMLALSFLVCHFEMFGKWITNRIPQGTGGSMEEQLKGWADIRSLASSQDGKTKGLSVIQVKGDPGYLKTATMIAETALAIALDYDNLSPIAKQGGVLTTATLGGELMAQRLMKYGGFVIASRDVTNVQDVSTALFDGKGPAEYK